MRFKSICQMLMSDQSCQEFLMSKNVLSVLVFINSYKTEIWHSLKICRFSWMFGRGSGWHVGCNILNTVTRKIQASAHCNAIQANTVINIIPLERRWFSFMAMVVLNYSAACAFHAFTLILPGWNKQHRVSTWKLDGNRV